MLDTRTVHTDDPEPARFLVETYPLHGRTADAVLHMNVPRTVLLDVVADVVRLAASDLLFTGEVLGGDDATEWCEPDMRLSDVCALHVYVDGSGDRLDVQRAALRVLTLVARRTSYACASETSLRSLSCSTLVWSEDRPLRYDAVV